MQQTKRSLACRETKMNDITRRAFVDELMKIGHLDEEQAEYVLKEARIGAILKAVKGLKPSAGWQQAAKMAPAEVAKLGPRGVMPAGAASRLAPAGVGAKMPVRGLRMGSRMTGGGGVGRGAMVA
jgi:hypothetical protein